MTHFFTKLTLTKHWLKHEAVATLEALAPTFTAILNTSTFIYDDKVETYRFSDDRSAATLRQSCIDHFRDLTDNKYTLVLSACTNSAGNPQVFVSVVEKPSSEGRPANWFNTVSSTLVAIGEYRELSKDKKNKEYTQNIVNSTERLMRVISQTGSVAVGSEVVPAALPELIAAASDVQAVLPFVGALAILRFSDADLKTALLLDFDFGTKMVRYVEVNDSGRTEGMPNVAQEAEVTNISYVSGIEVNGPIKFTLDVKYTGSEVKPKAPAGKVLEFKPRGT